MRSPLRILRPAAITFAACALLAPLAARAAIITVTTNQDQYDSGAECSLREAVEAANTNSSFGGCPAGDDTGTAIDEIDLAAATYLLDRTDPPEDANHSGDLDILEPVRIVGVGKGLTIIDGNGTDRVFDVLTDFDTVTGQLQLEHLTVQNGNVSVAGGLLATDGGGAIRIGGELLGNALTFTRPAVDGRIAARERTRSVSAAASNPPFLCQGVLATCGDLADVEVLDSSAPDAYGGGILNRGFLILQSSDIEISVVFIAQRSDPDRSLSAQVAPLQATTARQTAVSTGVLVRGNSALEGGGIYNVGIGLILFSTVDDNTASQGGGIYNEAEAFGLRLDPPQGLASLVSPLDLSRLTLPQDMVGLAPNLLVEASTISRNHAIAPAMLRLAPQVAPLNSLDGEGGGIWSASDALLSDSTVSGNDAAFEGGGMFVFLPGNAGLFFSTVTDNTAPDGAGIFAIPNNEGGGIVILEDTIVGKNHDDDCGLVDSIDGYDSEGGNIDSDGSCDLDATGDKPNMDPKLGPLADNGGPTETHLPLPGSPAIDMAITLMPPAPLTAGEAPLTVVDCGLSFDQRLLHRPSDGDHDGTAICDIGAVEVQVPLAVPALDPRGLALLVLVLALGGLAVLRRSTG